MIIKEFSPELIREVVELQETCFSDGWTESMIKNSFDGGRYFGFTAYDGEKLIGFIACALGLDDCDLESVAVLPEYRGRGVASQLMSHVLERVKANGLNRILLEVREGNRPALGLYEKFGFKGISVRKKYYSDGENAVVMEKEI